ncbi:MAG: methionyl-tRNA formyltransferase [Candidatus Melainabacteria bacterium]|nr:methionyl-tRNA formyltransferase [Candidatus Melainabacteria bacterium]
MRKIALFGLTGFGNAALRALCKAHFTPIVVVTRREPNPHPYYEGIDLRAEAQSLGIPVLIGAQGEAYVETIKPDIVLVSTYHRILRKAIFAHAKYALNIHPSLLPTYRGASPVYWVLRNGQNKTGVTIHLLTESVDAGDIVLQREIAIAADETQGSLREKLAALAGELAVEVLYQITSGNLETYPQDAAHSTTYPRLDEQMREVDLSWSDEQLDRHVRALTPFPGALLHGKPFTQDS